MPFEDKELTCEDCGQTFVHSAEDQARYAERGFTNEPKRCRDCRDKRKAEGGGRPHRSGGPSRSGGGGSGGRPDRQSFAVTCSECGSQTTVPFKPTEGRPVYCRDCFQAKRH